MPKGEYQRRKWTDNKPGTREWQDRIRARIQVGKIIGKLEACALGEVELTSAQVSAGRTLIDRCLPVLSHAERVETAQVDPMLGLQGKASDLLQNPVIEPKIEVIEPAARH